MRRLDDVNVQGKRVLVREDLNVPIEQGQIASDARIRAALPTLKRLLADGAQVMVCSHLGRPSEGEYAANFSLAPVADRLSELLAVPVALRAAWEVEPFPDTGLILFENTRFNLGEKANDPELGQTMAKLCDVFVMDAFSAAHRAHASTESAIRAAKIACAGPLLCAEIDALSAALTAARRPTVAIIGGAKVSTKFDVLENLLDKADTLIVGGGIANTLLAAKGFHVGASLYESDCIEAAHRLFAMANDKGVSILLPDDVVVAPGRDATDQKRVTSVEQVRPEEAVFDVGPQSIARYCDEIAQARTILWNGPIGLFEIDAFSAGTEAVARAVAKSSAFSVAGGGDTLHALEKYALWDAINHVSTAGGAFLEYVEGKALPSIAALNERAE